eukprot:9423605-Pyramimonas_sp.AAC.1
MHQKTGPASAWLRACACYELALHRKFAARSVNDISAGGMLRGIKWNRCSQQPGMLRGLRWNRYSQQPGARPWSSKSSPAW